MSKFFGVVSVAICAAMFWMSSATNQVDGSVSGHGDGAYAQCDGGAGLQSLSAFSSCSGGGAGLQSFSDCSGGGAAPGPGLQSFSPQAYYPTYWSPQYTGYGSGGCGPMGCPAPQVTYYQPQIVPRATYYARSAPVFTVPVTVRRPSVNFGLLNFSVGRNEVPAGIRLNPGETYVAGSLRTVTRSEGAVAKAAPAEMVAFPEGMVAYQFTQSTGCPACIRDQKFFAALGVPLTVVNLDGTAEERALARKLLDGHWMEVEEKGIPVYVSTVNGKRVAIRTESLGTLAEAKSYVLDGHNVKAAYVAWQAKQAPAVAVSAPAEESLAAILKSQTEAFRELAAEIRADREQRGGSVGEARTAAIQ